MTLSSKIEAILFYKAEPVTIKELCKLLGESKEAVLAALAELDATLTERGIAIVRNDAKEGDGEVMLATSNEAGAMIEAIRKDELSRDLGKAALETLSIIAYKAPVSKREIDYIRGVNSSFIIRNLLIRGLIERVESEGNERGYFYKPTIELLSLLGAKNIGDLPEYDKVKTQLAEFTKKEDKNEEYGGGSEQS